MRVNSNNLCQILGVFLPLYLLKIFRNSMLISSLKKKRGEAGTVALRVMLLPAVPSNPYGPRLKSQAHHFLFSFLLMYWESRSPSAWVPASVGKKPLEYHAPGTASPRLSHCTHLGNERSLSHSHNSFKLALCFLKKENLKIMKYNYIVQSSYGKFYLAQQRHDSCEDLQY